MGRSLHYDICSKDNGVEAGNCEKTYIKFQLWITGLVLIGNILIGYTLGWSAPVAQKLQDEKKTPLPYLLTDGEISWAAAVVTLGVIVGANGCGYLSNIIGRKSCLILGWIFIIIGSCLVTAAVSLVTIYTGRVLAGFGSGSIAVNNLVYIGEIASTNIRGTLLASTGVMHTAGCLLVYSIGPFFSYYTLGGVVLALSAIFTAGCFIVPESPMFYMIKGESVKAKTVLCKLGRSRDIDKYLQVFDTNTDLLQEKLTRSDAINKEILNGETKWECLQLITIKSNKRAFIIAVVLFIIQQAGGSNAILFYSTTIFSYAVSSVEPNIATIILGTTQLFGMLFTPILIERMGRRILILVSTSGCCVCMGLMGVHFYLVLIRHPCLSYLGWSPVVVLILNVVFYNMGLGIIPSTLIGEMFSPNVRSIGSCISMSVGLVFGFVCSVTFGHMVAFLGGHVIFWIYAAVNGIGFVFSLTHVPETKGKSLDEIRFMLAK